MKGAPKSHMDNWEPLNVNDRRILKSETCPENDDEQDVDYDGKGKKTHTAIIMTCIAHSIHPLSTMVMRCTRGTVTIYARVHLSVIGLGPFLVGLRDMLHNIRKSQTYDR